jgi:hypothetical protein
MNTKIDRPGRRTYRGLVLASLSCVVVLLCALCGRATAATWTRQPNPRSGIEHGDLAGVSCTATTACIAVGSSFRDDPEVLAPLIERWNGVGWKVQATVSTRIRHGELWDVSCTSGIACTAVGDFDTNGGNTFPLAARWNGSGWRIQPVPPPKAFGSRDDATLDGVSCTSRRACTAVGFDEDTSQPLAERWNGSRWMIQRTPSPGQDGGALFAISCSSSTSCTAVGESLGGHGCMVPFVEGRHGSGWSIEPSVSLPDCGSPDDSAFNGVSCVSASGCTAVGDYDVSGAAYDLPLVEQAPAHSWSIQSTPPLRYRVDPWGGGAFFDDVACTSSAACIAVGGAGSDVKQVPLVERRAGGQWQPQVIRGIRDGVLLAVSCISKSKCTAVGADESLGPGTDVPLVERLS